ncbi:MAG: lipid-A-disaccharide synthase [Alphaproteobacteria bacterium]
MDDTRPLDVFVIAGESSGDQLGAHLMDALVAEHRGPVTFRGVGGERMEARGLTSLFPMTDIALFGITSIIAHIPRVLRRVNEMVEVISSSRPDVLVLIDCPGFNRRVGRKIRKIAPDIPIVFYVSPSVWAWRPGRAKEMAPYVDHLLALLPFEPAVHAKLGGPPTTYVGHPIVERLDELRPNAEEAQRRNASPPRLLLLPGSRSSEIKRLAPVFRDVLTALLPRTGPLDLVLPVVPHVAKLVEEAAATWPGNPKLVYTDAEKFEAFRTARAAFACSGTVTLELAVAGVPEVMVYRAGSLEAAIVERIVITDTAVLANQVLGEKIVPEFIQRFAKIEAIVPALLAVLGDTPERARQLEAFSRLDEIMMFAGETPSARAARVVLETIDVRAQRRGRA